MARALLSIPLVRINPSNSRLHQGIPQMKIASHLLCVGSSLLIVNAVRAGNVVQNGSFEDGTYIGGPAALGSEGEPLPVDWTFTPATDSDSNGDNNSDFLIGSLGTGETQFPVAAESGTFYAAFGAVGTTFDYISQNVTTVASTPYTVSFWLNNTDSEGASQFTAYWNGADLGTDITTSAPDFGWTQYSYDVEGSGSDTLSFGGLNVPAWIMLDNVQVDGAGGTPVPDQGVGLATLAATLLGLCALSARNFRRRLI
jgi:hypothetical protein